jgi:hypothetical protein
VSERAKAILAVILLGVAAVGLWRAWTSGPETPAARRGGSAGVDDAAAASRSGKKTRKMAADDIPVVLTALARAREDETFVRERSLFDYAQSPEEVAAIEEARKAAELKRAQDEAERLRVLQEHQAKQAEEAKRLAELKAEEDRKRAQYLIDNPPKPVPPRFAFEYIGVIGPKDDAYAILRGSDQKLSYAKAGDVVATAFRIERVAKFVLDLTYTEAQFAGEIGQVQRTFAGAPTAGRR